MDYEALQMVVGMALTDQQFMGTLITDRSRAISGLPLSEEEAGVLLSMPGRNFEDLSKRLDSWITRHTRAARPATAGAGVHDWL